MGWKTNISTLLFLLGLFSLAPAGLQSQQTILNTPVSLNVTDSPLEDLLAGLETRHGFTFSYQSGIIPAKKVSFYSSGRPLGKTLMAVFGDGYQFKSYGKHVIILKNSPNPDRKSSTMVFTVRGRVVDKRSGTALEGATVYDITSLHSALTDSTGLFEIRVKTLTSNVGLRCGKELFRDSVIVVSPGKPRFIEFQLEPDGMALRKINPLRPGKFGGADTLPFPLLGRFVSPEMAANSLNAPEPNIRLAQLSLLPGIGTNFRMSGAVVNHFSINLIGGYSAGVSGFEGGGLFNITRLKVSGFQWAGGLNLGPDTLWGVQIAGLANVCTHSVQGIQISPLVNLAKNEVRGAQIAGLFNYSARPGFQLGLINFGDSASGAPLGVFNRIRGGFYALEASSDAFLNPSLGFLMGTKRLHSITGLSLYPQGLPGAWSLNWGLGTRTGSAGKTELGVEVISHVIAASGWFDSNTLSRLSLKPQIVIPFFRHFEWQLGPLFEILISGKTNALRDSLLQNTNPWGFRNYCPGNTRFDGWVSAQTGLIYRF